MEEYRIDAEESSRDTEIIGLYDKEKTREILHKMDVEEATKKGIKEGIEKKTFSLIKNMKKDNLSDELICKYLDITTEELNEFNNML